MSRPLTVLSLNTERTWRGGEGQTLALATGLQRRGHRSVVVAQPGSPMAQRSTEAGLPVQEIRMGGELDPRAIFALRGLFRRERPDIVHMHTSHAHTLGVLASWLAGHGRRIVSRRVDFSIYRHAISLSGLKYRHGVDRYIAISAAIRNALIQDGVSSARISLVHSGVDPDRFQGGNGERARQDLGVPDRAPLVGTLAHFGWHKSLETLVQAAAPIVQAVPEAWVAIVGDGSLRPQLEQERSQSAAASRVLLPGFRSNVADFLAAFDVFVMPSVMEGLCTSILDAFATRVPVVASNVGGIPELVEDEKTGLLAEPKNVESLATAVIRALRDPTSASQRAEQAHAKLMRGFTEDAMVEGNLRIYREVLAAQGS